MVWNQNYLDIEERLGGRMVMRGTPAEIKAAVDGFVAAIASTLPPPSDAVITTEGELNGIKYRIYRPRSTTTPSPLPVGIWTHGGGWMTGGLHTDDALCRVVAERTPSIIINVDYRLTPEHKFPTQLEDTLMIFHWAHANATSPEINGDPSRFYTIGCSAGGSISLEIANRFAADPSTRHLLKGIAALVPSTVHYDNIPEEYTSMHTSYVEHALNVPLNDKESLRIIFDAAGADPHDADIFVGLPANKDNYPHFPPTYFVNCDKDPLRDDAYLMQAALRKAGVKTKLDFYEGLPHYFWITPGLPETKGFEEDLVKGVQWLVGQM